MFTNVGVGDQLKIAFVNFSIILIYALFILL